MTERLVSPQAQGHRIFRISLWVTYLLGAGLSLGTSTASDALIAAAVAGVWVVLVHNAPRTLVPEEAMVVLGVVSTQAAVALTGGPTSGYILLSLLPVAYASLTGRQRTLWAAALLDAGALAAMSLAAGQRGLAVAQGVLLYLVFAGAMTQTRRLVSIDNDELERQGELFRRIRALTEIATPDDLDPGNIARRVAHAIHQIQEVDGLTVTYAAPSGDVIVYDDAPDGEFLTTEFPLGRDGAAGSFAVHSADHIDGATAQRIRAIADVAGAAFTNAHLFEAIAQRAVQEERARLARELHDEIGPSIAALGLSLDALANDGGRGNTSELHVLRARIESIVLEIRNAVSDLRASPAPTLSELVPSFTEDAREHGVDLVWHVDELEPVGLSRREDLNAAVREAIRNALNHASASKVVVSGYVGGSLGRIVISDDGAGFAPDQVPEGRYGLIGMRERMERLGGTVHISQRGPGATITLVWPKED